MNFHEHYTTWQILEHLRYIEQNSTRSPKSNQKSCNSASSCAENNPNLPLSIAITVKVSIVGPLNAKFSLIWNETLMLWGAFFATEA